MTEQSLSDYEEGIVLSFKTGNLPVKGCIDHQGK